MSSVFVSYSRENLRVAEQLRASVGAAGFDVWMDVSKIQQNWSAEIGQALVRCDTVCLLWTTRSAASDWVRHEWLTARALEKHIVPVVESDAPALPEPLRHLQAVPVDALADRLRPRLQACARSAARYDFSVLPAGTHIPYLPNPNFTGRAEDLLTLYLALVGGLQKVGVSQVGAVGLGGIGKTQLAAEFACRFGFAFDAVFWLDAADHGTWLKQFVSIARDRLALRVAEPTGAEASTQYLVALSAHLRRRRDTLIIMDNVVSPELLADEEVLPGTGLTPLTLGGSLLFTTRKRFSIHGVKNQTVDVLSERAALDLLTAAQPPGSADELASATTICASVGRLPLALALASSAIRKRRLTYGAYLRHLEQEGLVALDSSATGSSELATRHAAAVRATLEEQWTNVESDTARSTLCLAAQMPQATTISRARLALFSSPGVELDAVVSLLSDYSLVTNVESNRSVRVHPLVREFACAKLSREQNEGLVRAAVDAMSTALGNPARIEAEIEHRGVDALLGDLDACLEMAADAGIAPTRVRQLKRLLERERNHLKGFTDPNPMEVASERPVIPRPLTWRDRLVRFFTDEPPVDAPTPGPPPSPLSISVVDQLQHRAQNMGFEDLSQAFAELAGSRRALSLRTYGSAAREHPALLRTYTAHAAPVLMAIFSADGRNILSASGDCTLVWWDVETGRAIRRLSGHTDGVGACALHPDGRHAISSSLDRMVIVWNLETGRVARTLKGHDGHVHAVKVSPTGDIAVSASSDETLIVWDLTSGRKRRLLKGHQGEVLTVAISDDGRQALSGSIDQKLILWDLQSGEAIAKLSGGYLPAKEGDTLQLYLAHNDRITDVAWHPKTNRAISCSHDRTLIVWDVGARQPIRRLTGHEDWINCVDFTPDGTRAISGGWASVIVWDVLRGSPLQRLRHSGVGSARCSSDGTRLLTAGDNHAVTLWDLTVPETSEGTGHANWVTALGVSANGERAISGSDDEQIIVWDAASGASRGTLRKIAEGKRDPHGSRAMRTSLVALSADARYAVTGGWDLMAMSWDVDARQLLGHFAHGNLFAAGDISAEGRRVALTYNGVLGIWSLEYHKIDGSSEVALGELEMSFREPTGDLMAVAIAPAGNRAITGSEKGVVTIWNLAAKKKVRSIRAHTGAIWAAAMSADGRRALAGSWDSTMTCWDTETGEQLQTFVGHRLPVSGVAFLEDPALVVSVSYDRSLVVWDVRNGVSVARLLTRSGIFSLAAARDRLVFGDADGSVHFVQVCGAEFETTLS